MNSEPIFIFGAHKSGTSLVRSILDGHSHIYSIPIESHYFQLTKRWVDYAYRSERPAPISTEELIKRMCDWIHLTNTTADKLSDSVAFGIFDENLFREAISILNIQEGDKLCIEKYFAAIYYANKGEPLDEKLRIVEKSVEHAEFAQELYQLFPRAKFIHIIRNPYSNLVSFRKFKSVLYGAPLMPRIIRSLTNSFYYLYKNQKMYDRNIYMVIRYEDLVTSPEKIIAKMCDFLELPFEDILLTPTYQGKPWGGNSTSGEVFQGISASHLDKWKDEILPHEVWYINRLFSFILQDYEYPAFAMNGSYWKRSKGESLKRYLYNRFYRYYL